MSLRRELPMSVREHISDALKDALRKKDKTRTSALRLVLAELEVAGASGRKFDELHVVRSYAKKLRKSADEYEALGRPAEAAGLRAELAVVEEFLPPQMTPAEIEDLVDRLIEEHDYGPRDLGRLMKSVMGEYGDRVDGRVVQQAAVRRLAQRDR